MKAAHFGMRVLKSGNVLDIKPINSYTVIGSIEVTLMAYCGKYCVIALGNMLFVCIKLL